MKQKSIPLFVFLLAGLLLGAWLSAFTAKQDAETTTSTLVIDIEEA